MRVLLFFALIVVGAGGYLAYFNDLTIQLTVYPEQVLDVPLVPLMLACIALGLAMGFLGTLLRDTQLIFQRFSSRRQDKHNARAQTLYLKGERARLAGRPDKAQEAYRKVTKINPEHVMAISRLGDLGRLKGGMKEALSLHRLAMRLEDSNPIHRLSLIDDYMQMEAFESAAQIAESGLEEDAKDQSLLVRLRNAREALGEWLNAAAVQQRLIHTSMDELDSHKEAERLSGYRFEAALQHLAEGQNDQGRSLLNVLVKEAPHFSPAYMALGELLVREDKTTEALALFQRAYDHTRDESFLQPIENLYIVHLEDPRETIRYFSGVAERDADNLNLRYYLGCIYYRLEMIDDALHIFTQLGQQTRHTPEMDEMLGRINLRQGAVQEALLAFGEASPPVPFVCSECEHPSDTWRSRCERCNRWGKCTPQLQINAAQAALPASLVEGDLPALA